MVGLLDLLGIGGGQQPMQAQMPMTGRNPNNINTSMSSGSQGEIRRGPDGRNYQYAETTGMMGDSGGQGWIPTSMEPRGGGFLQKLLDPSIAMPLAAALMQPGDFGSNLGKGFAGAGEGIATRKKLQQERLQQNATAKWLESQGADAGLVELAKSGAGREAMQMWQASKKEKGLMPVGGKLYDRESGQWISPPSSPEDEEYGLNPVYGTDENNNTVIGQMSKNGKFKPLDMPSGFKPSTGVEKIDLGTSWGLYDKRTGTMIGSQPKDVAGESSQKALGTAQGEARAQIPGARAAASVVSQQVNDLINDPYLPNMLGPIDSQLPNSTEAANRVQGKMNQIKGQAFLQARQMLKGGGAITDYEGQKAEAAYARLSEAQSVEDYTNALREFEYYVQMGLSKLEASGGGQQQPQGIPAPQGNATSTGVQWRVK